VLHSTMAKPPESDGGGGRAYEVWQPAWCLGRQCFKDHSTRLRPKNDKERQMTVAETMCHGQPDKDEPQGGEGSRRAQAHSSSRLHRQYPARASTAGS
jgi:hypothetical protein